MVLQAVVLQAMDFRRRRLQAAVLQAAGLQAAGLDLGGDFRRYTGTNISSPHTGGTGTSGGATG